MGDYDKIKHRITMKLLFLSAFLAALPISVIANTPDARLNELYGVMRSRLADNSAGKEKLIGAQRAWIAFRDNECRFRTSGIQGSAVPMVYSACVEDLTRKRVNEFEGLLNCPEGDLACPIPRAR